MRFPVQVSLRCILMLLLAVCVVPGSASGQSQAQAGEEYLEFQRVDRENRKVFVVAGDGIRVPVRSAEGRWMESVGKIDSWTDSTIVYRERGTNALAEVNLNAAPYIQVVYRKKRIAGWVLLGLAAPTVVLTTLAIIIVSSLFGSVGGILLVLFLSLLLNPVTLFLLGLGTLLLKLGRRKLNRTEWRRRRVRRVVVRRPQPGS